MHTHNLQDGDLVTFSAYTALGVGINLATYGVPFFGASHIAIVGTYDRKKVLFESTTLNDVPCLIQGERVSGVQATDFDDRTRNYRGKVFHHPLSVPLTRVEKQRLNRFLLSHIGKDYDAIGAFRSGGIAWSWIESKLRRADLTSLFCSEYCAAAHKKLNRLETKNVSRWSPNAFIRRQRRDKIVARKIRVH